MVQPATCPVPQAELEDRWSHVRSFAELEACAMDVARRLREPEAVEAWMESQGLRVWSTTTPIPDAEVAARFDELRTSRNPDDVDRIRAAYEAMKASETPRITITGSADFDEFRKRHPEFRPRVGVWKPYGFGVIIRWNADGTEPDFVRTSVTSL